MNRSLSRGKPGAIARIAILALACGWLSAGPAIAAEPAAAGAEGSAAAGKRFGVVWRIRGEVAADPGSAGGARQLRAGDPVYVGEHVRAARSGEALSAARFTRVMSKNAQGEMPPKTLRNINFPKVPSGGYRQ